MGKRLRVTPGQLLSDFELYAPKLGEAPSVVRDAIRLSMLALRRDPSELCAQLVGRLSRVQDVEVARVVQEASELAPAPWFRPCWPSLSQAGGPEVGTLLGHSAPVCSVRSSDGDTVVTGSRDGTINVWELRKGRLVRSIRAHENRLDSLAITPDGRIAVSSAHDGALESWDTVTGAHLRTFVGGGGGIRVVALSSDGKHLVSGATDGRIGIWDLHSGELLRTLYASADGVYCIAIAESSRVLAVGSSRGESRTWNFDTGERLHTLETGDGIAGVNALAATKDGRMLAFGSGFGEVGLWSLETGRLVRRIQAHNDWVTGLLVTPDASALISTSRDGTIKRWVPASGDLTWSVQAHEGRVWSLAACDDGRMLVSGGDDGLVKLWRTDSSQPVAPRHDFQMRALGVSRDGSLVVSACGNHHPLTQRHAAESSTVCAWDGPTALVRHSAEVVLPDGPDALALAPDENSVAVTFGRSIRQWKIGPGRELRGFEGHQADVHALAFCREGRQLVSAGADHTLRTWDVESGVVLDTLEVGGNVLVMAVGCDGSVAVLGRADGTLAAWNLLARRCLFDVRGHEGRVLSVALSPDGRVVASGADDKLVKMWSRQSGELLGTLAGHENAVSGVALWPTDSHIVSASFDRTLRFWDASTGQCLVTLTLDSAIIGLGTAGDGQHLVTGDARGNIHLFQLVSSQLRV
jgi:WD40 repeat protein